MDRGEAIKFLRAHPALLSAGQNAIVRAMQHAGIVSPTTYWRDVNVGSLIKSAMLGFETCPLCGHKVRG
jgi:hypothetical protein